MSELVADILIYLLLFTGVGFGGIALMGLMIFPDIRSRMYTAFRACLICITAILGSAIIYAITQVAGSGGVRYFTFLIHVIFLGGVIAVAVMIINREILKKTRGLAVCENTILQPADEKKKDS
jgi:hypothetical protein